MDGWRKLEVDTHGLVDDDVGPDVVPVSAGESEGLDREASKGVAKRDDDLSSPRDAHDVVEEHFGEFGASGFRGGRGLVVRRLRERRKRPRIVHVH